MDSLIETFHIDWRLLIAQVVNFAIVFAVLYWLAFKPLARVMAERTAKIEKGLADAGKAEAELTRTQEEFSKTITEAKRQAGALLAKAAVDADARKQEMIARAKEEIGGIINQEKQKMQAEKAATLKEIKKEAADLVIAVTEKVMSEKLDAKKDKETIKRLLSNFSVIPASEPESRFKRNEQVSGLRVGARNDKLV